MHLHQKQTSKKIYLYENNKKPIFQTLTLNLSPPHWNPNSQSIHQNMTFFINQIKEAINFLESTNENIDTTDIPTWYTTQHIIWSSLQTQYDQWSHRRCSWASQRLPSFLSFTSNLNLYNETQYNLCFKNIIFRF